MFRFLVAALGVAFIGCGSESTPVATGDGGAGQGGEGGLMIEPEDPGPPDLGEDGLCGNQIHEAIANAPNIYFVLDASGSMAATDGGSTRYARVRSALAQLVQTLGPLIKIGAAVFPFDVDNDNQCSTGSEVYGVRQGDPVTDKQGPVTLGFLTAINVEPFGGTPTAASLVALYPKLTALSGNTIVILATDGGPNCNLGATCGPEECMINIEGGCNAGANCCDDESNFGTANCLDRGPAVQAVSALAQSGIDVYVIGIPGSEIYANTLSQMAIVGGAATLQAPFYYRVDDLDNLEGVLGDIASVVVSCEFDLLDPPEEPGFTNVYLDQVVLPFDSENGWDWKTDAVVELKGQACQRLKQGKVKQVQIVSGCPTEQPK